LIQGQHIQNKLKIDMPSTLQIKELAETQEDKIIEKEDERKKK